MTHYRPNLISYQAYLYIRGPLLWPDPEVSLLLFTRGRGGGGGMCTTVHYLVLSIGRDLLSVYLQIRLLASHIREHYLPASDRPFVPSSCSMCTGSSD